MQLYTGIDLHSSNSYLAIIDETGKRIFKRKLPNDAEQILFALAPYRDAIIGIVIESTYNWYWLVDRLMAEGYKETQSPSGRMWISADDSRSAPRLSRSCPHCISAGSSRPTRATIPLLRLRSEHHAAGTPRSGTTLTWHCRSVSDSD
jgi:hypothetical protein